MSGHTIGIVTTYSFRQLPWREYPAVQIAVSPTGAPVDPTATAPQARRRRPVPTALLTALAVAGVVALLPFTRVFETVERRTQDTRFYLRGPIPPHAALVIAGLDEKSEQAWSREPMVFWTGHYADMIRNARAAGARVIGFDVIPEVSGQRYLDAQGVAPRDGGPDTRFAQAIQDAGADHLVFAQQIASNGVGGSYLKSRPIAPADIYLQLPEVADNLGFADLPAASDGVIRESFRTARAEDGGEPVPSFTTLLARRARAAVGKGDAAKAGASDEALPSFYVDYTGTALPRVSAVDLATNTLTAGERAALSGSVVLIGWTAPDGTDWQIGPEGRVYSGVEVQAQAVATLLDGRVLRRWEPRAEALVTLLVGTAAALWTAFWVLGGGGRRGGAGGDAVVLGLLGAAWALAAYLLFAQARFLLPVVAPLLALALPPLCFRAVHAATEWLRRRQVETQFGHYATPEIRDYLLAFPDLQPELRDLSVLFLDIRGSTRYAEKHAPETVLGELNEMFRAIDGVLQKHHGLLYRYTGDGFLAVFGAPKPSPEHAADAIACAIDLLRETERFNRRRAGEGRERWSVGCSVNSGHAAAGKIGTALRSEYTVIGDVVNLAAKIESKNKKPDGTVFSDLVITDATLTRAPGRDRTADLVALGSAVEEEIGGRRDTARLSFYRLSETATGDEPAPNDSAQPRSLTPGPSAGA